MLVVPKRRQQKFFPGSYAAQGGDLAAERRQDLNLQEIISKQKRVRFVHIFSQSTAIAFDLVAILKTPLTTDSAAWERHYVVVRRSDSGKGLLPKIFLR